MHDRRFHWLAYGAFALNVAGVAFVVYPFLLEGLWLQHGYSTMNTVYTNAVELGEFQASHGIATLLIAAAISWYPPAAEIPF